VAALQESLHALAASGVLLSGLVVPLLTLGWATSKAARAAIAVSALIGYLATATMVVVWLAKRSALGWGLYGSAPFLWAMGGFVLLAAFLALMLGTFATDAPRPRAQTLAAFWITFVATLLVFTGVGIPFAALVSRPATLWLRPLIAIGALFAIVAVISPLASVATWIASRRRSAPEEEPWK
jgi:hypothetical protein